MTSKSTLEFRDLAFDYQIACESKRHEIMSRMIEIMKNEKNDRRKKLMKKSIKTNIEVDSLNG